MPFAPHNDTESAEEDAENVPDDTAEEDEGAIDDMVAPPRGSSLLNHTQSSRRRFHFNTQHT